MNCLIFSELSDDSFPEADSDTSEFIYSSSSYSSKHYFLFCSFENYHANFFQEARLIYHMKLQKNLKKILLVTVEIII